MMLLAGGASQSFGLVRMTVSAIKRQRPDHSKDSIPGLEKLGVAAVVVIGKFASQSVQIKPQQ
jgi:hypothetical protein